MWLYRLCNIPIWNANEYVIVQRAVWNEGTMDFFVNLLENFSVGHSCTLWHLATHGNNRYVQESWTKLFDHCKAFAGNSESRTCNSVVGISVWLLEHTHLNIAKIIAWSLELLFVDTHFEVWVSIAIDETMALVAWYFCLAAGTPESKPSGFVFLQCWCWPTFKALVSWHHLGGRWC